MATVAQDFGLVKIKDDGTNLTITYDGTVRLVIAKGDGDTTIGAVDGTGASTLYASAVSLVNQIDLTGTGTKAYCRFHNLTTAQRDAITAAAGMVIYNTTTSKLQVYSGGAWVDLH